MLKSDTKFEVRARTSRYAVLLLLQLAKLNIIIINFAQRMNINMDPPTAHHTIAASLLPVKGVGSSATITTWLLIVTLLAGFRTTTGGEEDDEEEEEDTTVIGVAADILNFLLLL